MLAIPANSSNLRLLFVEGEKVKEETVVMNQDQYEFITLLFCGKKIDVIQEDVEMRKMGEATLNTVFESSEEDDSRKLNSAQDVQVSAVGGPLEMKQNSMFDLSVKEPEEERKLNEQELEDKMRRMDI